MTNTIGRIRVVPVSLVAAACIAATMTSLTYAQSTPSGDFTARGEVTVMDQATLITQLRAMGHPRHAGISRAISESSDARNSALPHFSGSFSAYGHTYPYTMLGYPPSSGKTALLQVVIIPLRMHFKGFGNARNISVVFDPMAAVKNIVSSPIFNDAAFPDGVGQFGDMLQRATFWNSMDVARQWHVRLETPVVLDPVDVSVDRTFGTLTRVGNNYMGNASGGLVESEMSTIMQTLGLQPNQLAIFVTGNVSADALGWHEAYAARNPNGGQDLHTMIYTSWFDVSMVGSLLADISTLNHEVGEWLNDPFVNNAAPTWAYPPASDPRSSCAGNPYLEVGDPQGDGATYNDFPTVVIALKGYHYHLQDLVMLPWFADQKPSTALKGWYDFPATNQITAPAVHCK
jgi:hypothetical protein